MKTVHKLVYDVYVKLMYSTSYLFNYKPVHLRIFQRFAVNN
jgi:hypothetical protein